MRQYLIEIMDYANPDRRIGKFYGDLEYDGLSCVNYMKVPMNWSFRIVEHFRKTTLQLEES